MERNNSSLGMNNDCYYYYIITPYDFNSVVIVGGVMREVKERNERNVISLTLQVNVCPMYLSCVA